jgi:hypothetical protein
MQNANEKIYQLETKPLTLIGQIGTKSELHTAAKQARSSGVEH